MTDFAPAEERARAFLEEVEHEVAAAEARDPRDERLIRSLKRERGRWRSIVQSYEERNSSASSPTKEG